MKKLINNYYRGKKQQKQTKNPCASLDTCLSFSYTKDQWCWIKKVEIL